LRQIPLAPSASYLLRTFARASVLVPHITNSIDVQLFQLEKLAANALINPLTVINDCTNGHLLGSDAITRVQRLLLYEISGVIGALPELQSVPGIKTRFAPERLLALSRQIIHKTARNTSSMLQDVARGTTTEIDYINGYFVRRGEEVGIACALNYMLVNLVKGKAQIMERGKEAEIPLDTSDEPDM
jgi:2-dehydropantoate 2-reductase